MISEHTKLYIREIANANGNGEIGRLHTGNIRISLTGQLVLLPVDIYKIFFLRAVFQEINFLKSTVLAL